MEGRPNNDRFIKILERSTFYFSHATTTSNTQGNDPDVAGLRSASGLQCAIKDKLVVTPIPCGTQVVRKIARKGAAKGERDDCSARAAVKRWRLLSVVVVVVVVNLLTSHHQLARDQGVLSGP
jgi:hypothetical protein